MSEAWTPAYRRVVRRRVWAALAATSALLAAMLWQALS